MRTVMTALGAAALGLALVATPVPAQTLEDLPGAGPALCEGADDNRGQPSPFGDLAAAFHDTFCAGNGDPDPDPGDDPGDDDGGPGPHCTLLAEFADGAEQIPELGPPFAAGVRDFAAAIGCEEEEAAPPEDDENDVDEPAPAPPPEDDADTEDDAEVEGAVEVAPAVAADTTTATPATGGALTLGATAGLGLLALAAFGRRLLMIFGRL